MGVQVCTPRYASAPHWVGAYGVFFFPLRLVCLHSGRGCSGT